MSEDALYRHVISVYGEAAQILQAIEECAELIATLNRVMFRGRGTKEDAIEEIADVSIMMEQLRTLFGPNAVDAAKAQKLNRLREMLGDK